MKTINTESPRYRVNEFGINSLSDSETLSLICGGKDSLEKCRKLLKQVDYNLKELARFSIPDLIHNGLTEREAQAISAALEIGRRKQLTEVKERPQILSSKDAFDILSLVLSDLPHEEFYVLYMNHSNRIIKMEKISQGGIGGTVADIRIILKKALQYQASGMIISHNHPSGNVTPSEADIKLTNKIKEGGSAIEVQLLDHVVISNDNYYSLADNGII